MNHDELSVKLYAVIKIIGLHLEPVVSLLKLYFLRNLPMATKSQRGPTALLNLKDRKTLFIDFGAYKKFVWADKRGLNDASGRGGGGLHREGVLGGDHRASLWACR